MRVDVYVIEDEHHEALFRVASRLLEKTYASGLRTWVLCANEHTTHALDDYLWTYKNSSFLPHSIAGQAPEGLNPPIQISTKSIKKEHDFHVLLNIRESTPEHCEGFERVLDLVTHQAKEAGRARYRTYRAQGFILHMHTI